MNQLAATQTAPTTTSSTPAAPSPVQRFRCINPRGYYAAPIGAIAGFRFSVAFGLVALVLIGLTLGVLSRIGTDMTPDGVVVRHFFSSKLVTWSSIRAFRTTVSRNAGTRITLVLTDESTVRLSAPTSNTGGLQKGAARIVAELASAR